jgi:hypothetical protein
MVWGGLVWYRLGWSGVVWSGLVWSGVVWSALVWSGLVWSGLAWCGLGDRIQIQNSEAIFAKISKKLTCWAQWLFECGLGWYVV